MNDVILYKKDGEITNRKVLESFLAQLHDGRYLLTAKSTKKRTLPQNAYLHSVIIPSVLEGLRDAGYNEVRDNEDAKKVIKSLFLKKKIFNEETGEIITEIVRDTSDLNKEEMSIFIEDVLQWASEFLNIHIPAPFEQMKLYQ